MLNIPNFVETLPISGVGFLGIFVAMAFVYLSVKVLCKVFKVKEDTEK